MSSYNTAIFLICCQFIVLLYLHKKTIAQDKLNIEQLKVQFKDEPTFNTDDILEFYKKSEPDIKATTLNWRIYNLTRAGVLKRIGRGKFKIGIDKKFIPEVNKKLKSLYTELKTKFPFLAVCLWNTSVLSRFMHHQPGKYILLVEVEKTSTEPVFYYLNDKKYLVFHETDNKFIDKYMPADKEFIVVKSLITEAPVQFADGVCTATIEKILVDIFSDVNIFSAQQGSELINVFSGALNLYTVNENRMLRYADRRGKKGSIKSFLKKIQNYH